MKRLFWLATAAGLCLVAIALLWRRGIDADIHSLERLTVAGELREYRIVVPRHLPKTAPLVFAFHGTGDSPESMAAYSQLDRLAASSGFILVYPAARRSMWRLDTGAGGNPDVRFFDELLATLSAHYRIDRSRVYVVGMSNGASFAQLLAAARPQVVAAVVAHSGSQPRDFASPENSPPILLVVGEDDARWPTCGQTPLSSAPPAASLS